MGKCWFTFGSKKCSQQLDNWKSGQDSIWEFSINEVELNKQLLTRKRKIEMQLDKEVKKGKN